MKLFITLLIFSIQPVLAVEHTLTKVSELNISSDVGMHFRSLSLLENKAGEQEVVMCLNEIAGALTESKSFIYSSKDNGVSWNKKEIQKDADNYFALEFSTSTIPGEIFWTGFTYDKLKKRFASIISRSLDSGNTWKVIDKYTLGDVAMANPDYIELAGDVKRLDKKTLLTIQTLYDSLGGAYWVTRKSSDDGASWVTTDLLIGPGNDDSNPTDITVTDKGNIFVTGWWVSEETNRARFSLTTRKSIDKGESWTFSDVFIPKPLIEGKAANATGDLIVSGKGAIYAFSRARFGDDKRDCLIRKSIDEGESWKSVDRFTPGGGTSCIYHEAHITNDGSLIAIAQDRSKDSSRKSHIRLFDAKTKAWSSLELPVKSVTMPELLPLSDKEYIIGMSVRSSESDKRNRVILYKLNL